MEVAFSPHSQQETHGVLDEQNEHENEEKNEEFGGNVKVNQYCSLLKSKGENNNNNNNNNNNKENEHDVLKVVCPDGLPDGVASIPVAEDPSCRICLKGDLSPENQLLKLPCHCTGCDMKTFIMEMLLQFPAQHQENLGILYQNHCEYVIGIPAIEDLASSILYTQEQVEPSTSTCEALLLLLTAIFSAYFTYLLIVCGQWD